MTTSASTSRAIAARYASALVDELGNAKTLADVEKTLTAMQKLLQESPELARALKNPTVSRAEKAAVMQAIMGKAKAPEAVTRFFDLLAANNRLDCLSDVIDTFHEKLAEQRGEIALEITVTDKKSAPVDDISKALDKATGKKTVAVVKEDPSILGGAVIKLGSTLMDCSVQGKLDRLAMSLKEHITNG